MSAFDVLDLSVRVLLVSCPMPAADLEARGWISVPAVDDGQASRIASARALGGMIVQELPALSSLRIAPLLRVHRSRHKDVPGGFVEMTCVGRVSIQHQCLSSATARVLAMSDRNEADDRVIAALDELLARHASCRALASRVSELTAASSSANDADVCITLEETLPADISMSSNPSSSLGSPAGNGIADAETIDVLVASTRHALHAEALRAATLRTDPAPQPATVQANRASAMPPGRSCIGIGEYELISWGTSHWLDYKQRLQALRTFDTSRRLRLCHYALRSEQSRLSAQVALRQAFLIL